MRRSLRRAHIAGAVAIAKLKIENGSRQIRMLGQAHAILKIGGGENARTGVTEPVGDFEGDKRHVLDDEDRSISKARADNDSDPRTLTPDRNNKPIPRYHPARQ